MYQLKRDQAKIEVDSVDGIKVVKANNLEGELIGQLRRLLDREVKPRLKMVLLKFFPMSIIEFSSILTVIGLSALTFFFPEFGMTFPALVALLLAMRRASPSLSNIASSSVGLNKWRRGLEVFEEVQHEITRETMQTM